MTNTDHASPATAYTPGPWSIHRLANGWPVITSDAHDIADVRFNGKGMPCVEANARLIAAAPAMLDELEKHLRDMEGIVAVISATLPNQAKYLTAIISSHRAAIARATGCSQS